MIGFNRKFKRPISMFVMTWVYQLFGWEVTQIYMINPFGESYLRLECRRAEK